MAWILCDGVDRTGKTTAAEYYRNLGYEVVHMSAPSKKFQTPGYTGPSYLDECLDLYMKYDGKDVFFDRTIYGELIWPQVYQRNPQLDLDDLDVLRDYEDRNDAKYILLHDPDADSHWQRCVQFKENLNKSQFTLARKLFYKMAEERSFELRRIFDFTTNNVNENSDNGLSKEVESVVERQHDPQQATPEQREGSSSDKEGSEQLLKLDRANAIKDIMSKRLLKKKGDAVYDALEQDIRNFLLTKLDGIFGKTSNDSFTNDEIFVLKTFVNRLKEKEKR